MPWRRGALAVKIGECHGERIDGDITFTMEHDRADELQHFISVLTEASGH